MSKVSELIRGMRQKGGLSQSEISRRTGIPQPRISRWESGDVAAGANDALKLMDLASQLEERAIAGSAAAQDACPAVDTALPAGQEATHG